VRLEGAAIGNGELKPYTAHISTPDYPHNLGKFKNYHARDLLRVLCSSSTLSTNAEAATACAWGPAVKDHYAPAVRLCAGVFFFCRHPYEPRAITVLCYYRAQAPSTTRRRRGCSRRWLHARRRLTPRSGWPRTRARPSSRRRPALLGRCAGRAASAPAGASAALGPETVPAAVVVPLLNVAERRITSLAPLFTR